MIFNELMKLIYYTFILEKKTGIFSYEILVCLKLVALEQPSLETLFTYLIGYYAISGLGWTQVCND